MPHYTDNKSIIKTLDITGFFVGWSTPPSEETFQRIIEGSHAVVLAHEEKKLIGFITCISDGVLSAYIPLLEVLPAYQSKGIGRELLVRMKEELKGLYMIDLLCDEALTSYYEKLGMKRGQGAFLRNYENQAGRK